MNMNSRITGLIAILAILLPAFTLLATESPAVSDLAGQWHGKSHFSGISYKEAAQKVVAPQDIEIVLRISINGKVTGQVGGAKLRGSVMEAHRGWIWRLLHAKSNFIVKGRIVGAVAPGSERGAHSIKIPFTFDDPRITGDMFVIYPIKYPYPFLSLRLTR